MVETMITTSFFFQERARLQYVLCTCVCGVWMDHCCSSKFQRDAIVSPSVHVCFAIIPGTLERRSVYRGVEFRLECGKFTGTFERRRLGGSRHDLGLFVYGCTDFHACISHGELTVC